jgi:hypothetical protein
MTGFKSKRAAALDEEGMYLVHQTAQPAQPAQPAQWDTPSEAFNEWWDGEYDDSTNPFTKDSIAYWAFAGWQSALAQERNFCPRCGKRTADLTTIHTCTPPQEKNT